MSIVIEVIGSIVGLLLILINIFGNVTDIVLMLLGIAIIVISHIAASAVSYSEYKDVYYNELSKEDRCDYNKINNAKGKFTSSVLRTTLVTGSAYKSLKNTASHVSHPENWDEV